MEDEEDEDEQSKEEEVIREDRGMDLGIHTAHRDKTQIRRNIAPDNTNQLEKIPRG